jgi:ribosomal protein S18 acetylase RimI-like enzyme
MVNYHECREEDFEEVFQFLKQLWPGKKLDEAGLRGVFIKGIKSEDKYYLCAEEDGRLVGFCSLSVKNSLWQEGNLGHVDELVTDESYRGRGIGTEMLRMVVEIAEAKRCKRIELDSAFERKDAHQFYKNNGFEERAILFSKCLAL